MQERVESTRTDAIPVMRQLFHHREPKDWLMGRMYEYMNPYKAEKEFSLMTGHRSTIPLLNQNRISIVYYRNSIVVEHLDLYGRQKRR
jgi:hypothetical protein